MALDPPFVVRVEKQSEGSFGETMSLIRSWLDHRHIEPASFQSVADTERGIGFEIGFNSADEAHLFKAAFRASASTAEPPATHRGETAANR